MLSTFAFPREMRELLRVIHRESYLAESDFPLRVSSIAQPLALQFSPVTPLMSQFNLKTPRGPIIGGRMGFSRSFSADFGQKR